MMKKEGITPEQALARLESLCARAEHSTGELHQKLRRWSIGADEADKIINSLIERRFLDDSRFTKAYIYDKYKFARWGRRKIAVGLMSKGISSGIYRELLEDVDQKEYEQILKDLLMAKSRSIAEVRTYEGRTKLYRFGLSRGYESELVGRLIKELFV